MTDRRIRFKLAWQTYRVGDVIEPPGTLRQWLIGRGYCEPYAAQVRPAQPAQLTVTATARRRSHA